MKRETRFIPLLLLGFLLMPAWLAAQESLNLGFLHAVPQSCKANPAQQLPYGWWMGIPALSAWHVGIENSGFTFDQVLYKTPDDSLHFNVNSFLNGLKKNNFISANLSTEILAFGFHVKNYYFEARVSERFMSSVHYSKDLMTMLFKLNGEFINQEASFGGTGLNMTLFHEVSFGASRVIDDRWSTGFRLKYLAGVANIYSRKTDISLFTDESLAYALTVNSDIEINASLPGIEEMPEDSLDFNIDGKKLARQLDGWQNPGFAIDLGATYQLTEEWLFGASLNDLGYIRWKNNPRNLVSDKQKHAYTFDGIDISEFITNDSTSLGKQFENLLDSLRENLGMHATYKAYTSYLLATVNLSARYTLAKRNHFGLLIRNEFFNRSIKPTLLLNYQFEAGKMLSLTSGYYLSSNNLFNLALGFSLKLGAFQFYMISDNAYAFMMPTKSKSANLQFGFNLCFKDRRFPKAPPSDNTVPPKTP